MSASRIARLTIALLAVSAVAACGNGRLGQIFNGAGSQDGLGERTEEQLIEEGLILDPERETIFDLFVNTDDPNTTVEVNRYLWNASLEILDFMPVEAADPFSGVIVFGYGTPPGGARAYRATVYVQDPALDARSLRVAVQSRGGAVGRDTARQIEDAILTRARQLRIRDGEL